MERPDENQTWEGEAAIMRPDPPWFPSTAYINLQLQGLANFADKRRLLLAKVCYIEQIDLAAVAVAHGAELNTSVVLDGLTAEQAAVKVLDSI